MFPAALLAPSLLRAVPRTPEPRATPHVPLGVLLGKAPDQLDVLVERLGVRSADILRRDGTASAAHDARKTPRPSRRRGRCHRRRCARGRNRASHWRRRRSPRNERPARRPLPELDGARGDGRGPGTRRGRDGAVRAGQRRAARPARQSRARGGAGPEHQAEGGAHPADYENDVGICRRSGPILLSFSSAASRRPLAACDLQSTACRCRVVSEYRKSREMAPRTRLLASSWSTVAEGYEREMSTRFEPWIRETIAEVTRRPLPPGPIYSLACGPGMQAPTGGGVGERPKSATTRNRRTEAFAKI